jgi:putative flippase GtrA
VSVGGFVANAAAYAALLRLTPLRYDVALALVLIVVAAATFLLSRRWVFKPQGRA